MEFTHAHMVVSRLSSVRFNCRVQESNRQVSSQVHAYSSFWKKNLGEICERAEDYFMDDKFNLVQVGPVLCWILSRNTKLSVLANALFKHTFNCCQAACKSTTMNTDLG